jgi:hypothetical protein
MNTPNSATKIKGQIYQGLQEVFWRAEDSEQRAVKAERQVKELTNEIKRLKESENAEMTRLKDVIMGGRARVEELAGKYQKAVDHSCEQEKELMEMTEEYEEMTDEYEELSENYSRLKDKLAWVNAFGLDEHERRTPEQDPGTPPVREAAAAALVEGFTENPLEPFRFGACRCRVWKDGQGTQCSHAGRMNGVCGHHHSRIEESGKGTWQFGFYDEPRPDIWGTDHEGKCLPIPARGSAGNEILWSMPQKEWARAFSSQYQRGQ